MLVFPQLKMRTYVRVRGLARLALTAVAGGSVMAAFGNSAPSHGRWCTAKLSLMARMARFNPGPDVHVQYGLLRRESVRHGDGGSPSHSRDGKTDHDVPDSDGRLPMPFYGS